MERFAPLIRISGGLVLVTCAILFGLDLLGLVPQAADEMLSSRMRLCETLAAQTAPAAQRNDLASIRAALQVAVSRSDDVLSAGLRVPGGRLLVAAGDHNELWQPESEEGSTPTHVRVPIFRGAERWATIEVRFGERERAGLLATLWARPLVRILVLLVPLELLAYLLYMRRTLKHLDPSAVIPARVHAALDVMAEGVLLLDPNQRIVLANAAFAERLERAPASLMGVRVETLGWKLPETADPEAGQPWEVAQRESRSATSANVRLDTESGERVFTVNASPVLDGWGRAKGAIVTFDDVTELDRKTADLEQALALLEKSQDEIRLQNEELQVLARRDPLTGVSNRRAFMDHFEHEFAVARREGRDLCCIMADIDHFKRVNDTHGHAAGDEVIKRVSEVLAAEVRSTDSVCRYGGEEFCLALLDTPVEAAVKVAERLRAKAAAPGFARVPITASFGVSSIRFGAGRLQDLIEQADEALYASKESGRDRVTRWDQRGSKAG